jgi:N-methylhydantoinase A/oxoprolinase/acetone carboxylase beta subunit
MLGHNAICYRKSQMSSRAARVGVDVGGTFTDVILHETDGRVRVHKLLSTPPTYDRAVVEAISGLAGPTASNGGVAEVVHGTTVATNAVLQRLGAETALVTTRNFRDVLELRRLRIPHMYDLFWRKPPPLVERRLRFEVSERLAADGTIVVPLDEDEVRSVAARLRELGIDSIAVCFLHSYLYPEHEERAGAILTAELPGATVSLSSEILREQREYERSATTVVNAYVRPLMSSYIDRIRTGLDGIGLDAAPLSIMQSSGGVMTSDDARVRPVFALESGPAAGVVAARGMADLLGLENAIAFDMGGTTAKASLIEHGAIARGREYEVGGSISAGHRLIRGAGELLRIPTIDIAEVGAGGGSMAWLDPAGGLQVGPRSAGADPGPACYGRGGVEPTVTDANVLLGFIPAGEVADGQITIRRELAEEAVARVAEPLGLTVLGAADGIHRIANARMTRALRSVSSEKGRDPRDFALIAYGGSGPIHAGGLADELGVTTILVPPVAGLFSAVGLLFARPEFHEVRSCHLDVDAVDPGVVVGLFDEMEAVLSRAFAGRPAPGWARTADLRYGGQSWEIEVELPDGSVDRALLAALRERFEDEHETLYGVRGRPGSPVEIRAVRLAALGPSAASPSFDVPDPLVRERHPTRRMWLGGGVAEVPVRSRASIGDESEPGPLLVDEYDTTVVVPDGWSVRRHPGTGTLVLSREDGARG